jgi:hypothetical protein
MGLVVLDVVHGDEGIENEPPGSVWGKFGIGFFPAGEDGKLN